MKNKKAAEMTIGTIVVIILALVVLVVLIYGFSTGWSNLWQNILGYGGGQVNAQTVVDSCKLACTTQQNYDYCTKTRTVTFQDSNDNNKVKTVDVSCSKLKMGGSVMATKPAAVSVTLPLVSMDCDLACAGEAANQVPCAELSKTLCLVNGVLNTKCSVSWIDQETYVANQQNVGTGKTYTSVSEDLRSKANDASSHTEDVCVMLVTR